MNTTIDGITYDTTQILNDSKERETNMAQSKAERNRKLREKRAALKLVPKVTETTALPELDAFFAPTPKAKVEDDLGMPAFLDRQNPVNEQAAIEARAKKDEVIRNRPIIGLVKKPGAAPVIKEVVKAAPVAKAAVAPAKAAPVKATVLPVKAKAAAAPAPKKAISAYQRMRLIVVKQPNISIEDLMKKLEAEGYPLPNRSTASTCRADTRCIMLLCQELKDVDLGCVA